MSSQVGVLFGFRWILADRLLESKRRRQIPLRLRRSISRRRNLAPRWSDLVPSDLSLNFKSLALHTTQSAFSLPPQLRRYWCSVKYSPNTDGCRLIADQMCLIEDKWTFEVVVSFENHPRERESYFTNLSSQRSQLCRRNERLTCFFTLSSRWNSTVEHVKTSTENCWIMKSLSMKRIWPWNAG